jgi:hypothetical protein
VVEKNINRKECKEKMMEEVREVEKEVEGIVKI